MEIAKEREDKENETTAYFWLGHSYRKKNQIDTAIEYYEKALEIAKEREDKENENIAYLELGPLRKKHMKITCVSHVIPMCSHVILMCSHVIHM